MKIQNQNIFCTNLHVAMDLVSMNRFHGCNPILRQQGKGENFKCSSWTYHPISFNPKSTSTFLHSYCCLPKRVIPHIQYPTNDNGHKDAHPNSQPMGTDVIHCQERRRRAKRSLWERSRAGASPEPVCGDPSPSGVTAWSTDQVHLRPKADRAQDVLQTDRVVGLGALLHRHHGQPDQDDWQCPLRHGREGDLPGPRVHPDPKDEEHQGGPREPGDARAATR